MKVKKDFLNKSQLNRFYDLVHAVWVKEGRNMAAIAQILDVSQTAATNWKRRISVPTDNTLYRWCARYLRCDWAMLESYLNGEITATELMSSESLSVDRAVRHILSLNPSQIQDIGFSLLSHGMGRSAVDNPESIGEQYPCKELGRHLAHVVSIYSDHLGVPTEVVSKHVKIDEERLTELTKGAVPTEDEIVRLAEQFVSPAGTWELSDWKKLVPLPHPTFLSPPSSKAQLEPVS